MGTSRTTTTPDRPRPGHARRLRASLGGALGAVVALVLGLALAPGAQASTSSGTAEMARTSAAADAVAATGKGVDGPVLLPGQTLKPGQRKASTDGRDVLVMQGDGNLVLYGKGVARWSTRTEGNPGARLVLQWDHNLVLRSTTNRVLWTSATHLAPQGTSAYLFHGELALLGGGEHVWSTRSGYDRLRSGTTLKPGQHVVQGPFLGAARPERLVMQSDGNLVFYDVEGKARWSTRTNGNPGARAVMQRDGNLVVYSVTNRPLWASGTRGAGLSLAVSPYTRGFFCDDLERVVYINGFYVMDRRDRPLFGYPYDVSTYATSVGAYPCP